MPDRYFLCYLNFIKYILHNFICHIYSRAVIYVLKMCVRINFAQYRFTLLSKHNVHSGKIKL